MMKDIYITNADLVLPDRVAEKTAITVRGDRIAAIGEPPRPEAELIPADGLLVLPGLIDLHYHGRLISLEPEKLPALLDQDCRDLVKTGVTRFLPTLASAPVPAWLAALPALEKALAQARESPAGAIPIGIHLEGNFLSPAAAGAHPPNLLLPFDSANPEHRAVFAIGQKIIRMMTFAPEVPGNEKLIELCRDQNILASLGHSAASPEQCYRFADLGLCHMTHFFNGMKMLYHRDPGPPLAGLLDDRITVDLIADGYHLHPEIIRLIHRLKPRDQRVLITDCVLINLPGAVSGEGDAPNVLPSGGLAGSRLKLNRAVMNYVRFTGCPLPEAAAMASLNPAAALGLAADLGSLEPGKLADLVLCDRDLNPKAVYIGGQRRI